MTQQSSQPATRGSNLRLGRFPYLNSLPLFHGLEKELIADGVIFTDGHPSQQAQALARGEVDCAMVSSAALGELENCERLSAPVIASSGAVNSVIFFSPVEFKALAGQTIYCTEASRTARALLELFFRHDGISPAALVPAADRHLEPGFQEPLLLIGDEAIHFARRTDYPWRADLGEVWTRVTGLPMVWGVFAVRRDLASDQQARCRELAAKLAANALINLETRRGELLAQAMQNSGMDPLLLAEYFQKFCYVPRESEEAGLAEFLALLKEYPGSF